MNYDRKDFQATIVITEAPNRKQQDGHNIKDSVLILAQTFRSTHQQLAFKQTSTNTATKPKRVEGHKENSSSKSRKNWRTNYTVHKTKATRTKDNYNKDLTHAHKMKCEMQHSSRYP